MSLGAFVAPDPATLGTLATGQVHLGATVAVPLTTAGKVISARLTIGASGATGEVAVNTGGGTVAAGTAGTRQTEVATVVAAAGCTAAGNLAITFTAAAVGGALAAINVPLTTTAHPTDTLIAAAIAAALNANATFAAWFTAAAASVAVTLTSRFPSANDATLNLAIAAGLGVTAAASSASGTAGVAGAIVGTYAPFAEAQDMDYASGVFVRVTGPGALSAVSGSGKTVLPPIAAGKSLLWFTASYDLVLMLQATGPTIADILIIGS
jgi:hypothetical protein